MSGTRAIHLLRRLLILSLLATSAQGEESINYDHGYAFLSTPKYPADFRHFAYVNPDAPKGGHMRVPAMGTWDTFNPMLERGRLADGLGFWTREENLLWDTLTIPSLDEPATQYGLLAEGMAVAEDGTWVAFKLREEARWHDGRPITAEDVAFTFRVIQEDAGPSIVTAFKPFRLEVIGPREVRFHLEPEVQGDAAIPIRLGGIPVMPKHYWEGRDITKTTLEPPLGSGPYRIGEYSVGRWVEFERVEDYWGWHLPVNQGRYNFDIVKWDYFRDDQVQTEGVKASLVDVHVENVPSTWVNAYDIPATREGYLKKVELKLARPAGLWWPIFWNIEQPRFQDIRVRRALWLLPDFPWGNLRSYGFWGHATSFFHDSELAATGMPSERELKLLEPLRDLVPESVFTRPYGPPPNGGQGWSRENLLEAAALLEEAGWVVRDNRLVHGVTGEPFHVRFVAVSPALGESFIAFKQLLARLGITASIKSPEISNWLFRMQSGDFDAGAIWFLPDYTPTLHISNWFESTEADKQYSGNWSNLRDPAVDALINAMREAKTWDDYVAAVRAFDRVMLHNYYWIPQMSKTLHAVAYWDKYGQPEHGRLARLAHIDHWWWDEERAQRVDEFTGGNE